MRLEYNGIGEYARILQDENLMPENRKDRDRPEWYGHQTWQEVIDKALKGDNSLVARAEALLDKISCDLEVPGREWIAAPYGAYPIVPEYLTGMPTPMRAPVRTESESTPINVWVQLGCNASITHSSMMSRGVGILALLLKLQQVRPVALKLVYIGQSDERTIPEPDITQIITVETPLDLSSACYALCDAGFLRRAVFGNAQAKAGWQGWPYRPTEHGSTDAVYLGASPVDIIIGRVELGDTLCTDPVAWVTNQLAKYTREGR